MTEQPVLKPKLIYGTAWKEERTQALTEMAIEAGCRAIDTANQRKHYFEAAVGEALHSLYRKGIVRREDIFLQTKFTYQRGQDHRLPYDPSTTLSLQVAQSFANSLEHLKTDYIDSFLLHGPATGRGMTTDDHEVWRAMESLQTKRMVRHIGVSNVSAEQLKLFYESATVKPSFVQNRCFAIQGWDYRVREYCRQKGIIYQGFSLLTANLETLARPEIRSIATKYKTGVAQVIFRFAQQIGMYPLTGTTRLENLKADLQCDQFTLSADDLIVIEQVALT